MPPKGQAILYPSRRFVCRSSVSRKSTTDLTENENHDWMKGLECLDIVGSVYHLVIYVVQQDKQCGLNEFFLQLSNGWTCRAVPVLPHTKVCKYSLYKTLLMMDR